MKTEQFISLALPFLLAAVWCCLCLLFSYTSGWHRLAQKYEALEAPRGKGFHLRSGKVGWLIYFFSLNIHVARDGIFISVCPLLGLGHPELFIPWGAIRSREDQILIRQEAVRLGIDNPELAGIELPKHILDGARIADI